MVQKDRVWLLFCAFILGAFIFVYPAFAEIKVFEKEVEEVVGRNQSQEQVEAFAMQKARRLAVEEAGIYLSSLTVVRNYQLQKDEVTVLAYGVTKSQVLGVPSVVVKSGVIHVTVNAKITVNTAVLDQQIKEIMKEIGTLKKLEAEQQKVREMEGKLANLKSFEVKRLDELNAQAQAMERDRDRQRLFREEQALKAKGELSSAEADRIAKEREMQERITRTMAEQEKARREEAAALAAEQDRVRRTQLESEQRWNELARKSRLAQSAWILVDDSLSLKQAVEEATRIKREIANFNQRMDSQFGINATNLKAAYVLQIALTTPNLPPQPAAKDAFETTTEYNERLANYERAVKATGKENEAAVEKLRAGENLNIAKAKTAYLKQKMDILTPFVKRLQDLQDRHFLLPEGAAMTVTLGAPEADQNRFPLSLVYQGQPWEKRWNYTDRNQARDFYKTRSYMKAEGMFQLEDKNGVSPRLTIAKVTHPGTGETRKFEIEKPKTFAEIELLDQMKQEYAANLEKQQEAAKLLEWSVFAKTYVSPATGMEFILVFPGCFQMGDTFGDGENNERPEHKVCLSRPYYIGKYEATQGQWKKVMGSNPSEFSRCGDDCPVAGFSWDDVQEFIAKLNAMEGTDKYGLPTEAQWEYAARSGGKQEKYAGTSGESGMEDYAWYEANSDGKTHAVGQKKPNGLGLYDMSGNVWEWVQDWYGNYPTGSVTDPEGPSSGSLRVNRGGSGYGYARYCRSAFRNGLDPGFRTNGLGFRLIRTR